MNDSGRLPKFGEWMRGIHASVENPLRDGMYVRTIVTPSGRMNAGTSIELTDGNGKFWRYPAGSVKFLDQVAGPNPVRRV